MKTHTLFHEIIKLQSFHVLSGKPKSLTIWRNNIKIKIKRKREEEGEEGKHNFATLTWHRDFSPECLRGK